MILVTGASGFTGGFVVRELQSRRAPFRCLVRDEAKRRTLEERGIGCVAGDVRDPAAWPAALKGVRGIINLVSFNQEHVSILLDEARKAGVRRVVLIGTTAIFTRLNAESKALRQRTEALIRESDLDWTILRPTMIYGARGDRNMERLVGALRRFKLHPILGRGRHLIQPVHVTDLARAVVDAFHAPGAVRREFNLSGGAPLTYREAVAEVARQLDRRVLMFSLPETLAVAAVEVARRIPGLPKLKEEQVRRLNEDKAFGHEEAREAWGYAPMDFAAGIRLEIEDLKREG